MAKILDDAVITSRFGKRIHPILKRELKHNGIDVVSAKKRPSCGVPVRAPIDGEVVEVGWNKVSGNYVKLDVGCFVISYVHLSRVAVEEGEWVREGQIVGYIGDTGRAKGCHLHITIRRKSDNEPIDPEPILKELGWI